MSTQKRSLPAHEQQLLRAILQTATLAALMDARRWEPGDIAFQGGTSLHLAYGSARFSEDLDFLVRGGLSLSGLAKQVRNKLRLPLDIAADLSVSVTPSKDPRNPHMFYVTLSGPQVVGSAKVKVELWQAESAALKSLALKVSTVSSPAGQAFVPTLTLEEIFADKVYALGARARIKPRDVFDLWWLCEKALLAPTAQALQTRLAIYPAPSGLMFDTAQVWLASAALRLQDLLAPNAAASLAGDLKRWLPSSWLMNEQVAATLLAVSIAQLQRAIELMNSLQSQLSIPARAPE
jgi:predicted nucleotidyltransferase component of viral defense system